MSRNTQFRKIIRLSIVKNFFPIREIEKIYGILSVPSNAANLESTSVWENI
jgi:hypothetical protein